MNGLSILHVLPRERRLLTYFLLNSFFFGASTVFAYTAAISLFLARFPATHLPYVYIASALFMIISGLWFTYIGRRIPLQQMLTRVLLFLLATAVFLWLGFFLSFGAWHTFALLLWFRVLFTYTTYSFWGQVGNSLTIQQGKRLLGIIGTGEMFALLIGYLSVPWLTRLVGPENLLLFTAVALLGNLIMTQIIFKQSKNQNQSQRISKQAPPHPIHLREVGQDHYLKLLLVGGMLTYILYFVIDFGFFDIVRGRYQSAVELARFIGYFYSIIYGIGIILRLFVTSSLLVRYGIRLGILLLPLLIFLSGVVLLPLALFGLSSLVFWLLLGIKLLEELLLRALYQPTSLLLYQPLAKRLRATFQALVDNVAVPIGIGFAGVILLFIWPLPLPLPITISLLLIGFAGAWLLATHAMFKGYYQRLTDVLSRRILEGHAFTLTERSALDLVQNKLQSKHPGEALYAMQLLEEAGETAVLQKTLPTLIQHPSPMVRQQGLRFATKHPNNALNGQIWHMALHDNDADCRRVALRTVAQLAPQSKHTALQPYLHHEDLTVRQAALAGLMRSPHYDGQQHLADLLTHDDPVERKLGASLVAEVGVTGVERPFFDLLDDADPEVQREAIQTVATLNDVPCWPKIIQKVNTPSLRKTAVDTLVAGGESALHAIKERLACDDTPLSLRIELIQICSRIGTSQAIPILKPLLQSDSSIERWQVVEALANCHYSPQLKQEREPIRQLALEYAEQGHRLQNAYTMTRTHPQAGLLADAIEQTLSQLRAQIFYLLSFIFDRDTILRAQNQLRLGQSRQLDIAFEAMELSMDRGMKTAVLPLLLPLSQPTPSAKLSDAGLAAYCLSFLPLESYHPLPWNKICAIYTLAVLGWEDALPQIEPFKVHDAPLLRETAVWAIEQLTTPSSQSLKEPPMLITLEKTIILKTVDTFSQIPDEILAEIAKRTQELFVDAGELLFEKGEYGDSMFITIEGKVRVHDGNRTLNHLGARSVFGEMAILDPAPRAASITAVEDTHLLQLHQSDLNELMEEQFEVAQGIIRVLSRHLRLRIDDIKELQKQLETSPGTTEK